MKPHKCIVCNKDIEVIFDGEEGGFFKEQYPYESNRCFTDGMVATISAGYGSLLDGNVYYIAICDHCAETKDKEGSLEYVQSWPHEIKAKLNLYDE